ncbi:hypothetical protein ACIO3O_30910 [Streptomyces sp. NPDC087440]|uniref:hypothetical protein n=1 Tax=Streptomyces sp. NPDC087440 TaxID=3365790 RepID=UPI003826E8AA
MAEVDLTLLGRTAADWKQTASHLKRLVGQARSGLLSKSERARWDGVNASVTRDFIRKTTKEFTDACTEATSIAHVLEDAHQELTKIQQAVRHIRDVEAPKLGMNLTSPPGMAAPSLNPTKPAEIELNQRLKVLVAHAAEIDTSVARALRKSHGSDPRNFGHRSYGSLDEAQSERALELAKVGPMLSNAQFTELNGILTFNAKDSDFSTAFYQGLGGPKQALDFYARMSLDCTAGDQPERLALAKDLQRAMGTALASATDPDNRTHLPASWAKEFRTLGTQPLPTPALGIDRPYGYQVLGGLLRYGDYDPRFLNPIAEDILRIHKEDPDFFMETKPTRSDDPDFGFNPSGLSGAGYDPLTSALEGLGHSPQAAKEFFKDGRHLDDLTSADFQWAADTLDRSSENSHEGGPDALGHALEAATTGHPWDDTRPGLHRDKETADIMKKVITLYSPTSDVKPQDAIMDSLGRMGAAYIDDLNYSTMDFGGSGDDLGRDDIFARSSDGSARTAFGEISSRNFMTLVAGDEEGYKCLSSAQQVYAASGLAAQEGDRDTGVSFAHNATKVHGILDAARSHQIAEDFKDDEDQWNLEKEKAGEWRKFAVSGAAATIAGVGSGLLLGPAAGVAVATAVPVVLETGAGVVSTAYGNHTLQYLKDTEFKNDPEALQQIQAQQHLGEEEAWIPVAHYADSVGMTRAEKRALNVDIEHSYTVGKQKLDPVRQVG